MQATDIKVRKSEFISDTTGNGGRKGQTLVVSGSKYNIFPRVTKAQRDAGLTQYRKVFRTNENADDEVASGMLVYFMVPMTGGDRVYLAKGTHTDTQGDLATSLPTWTGVGALQTALAGSETSVAATMESNDFEFEPGSYVYIHNKILTSQTIGTGVKVGNSVQLSGGTWGLIAATTDIAHPKGIYIGDDKVLTAHSTSTEEFLQMITGLTEDEDIGTGDGSNTAPTLTTLANVTNGLCTKTGFRPVVTATCGGVARTVNVSAAGACSGYCSAGQLNMATGAWTTPITWSSAPDSATDVTVTYYRKNYSYSGNVVTLELADTVGNVYLTADTFVSGCVYQDEVKPASAGWTETTTAGTYNESTYPVVLYNDGTEYDSFTLTFTSGSAFSCSGAREGSLGTGSTTVNFSPVNPSTGQPYFTINKDGWGGTWAAGNTITFTTSPSGCPLWIKRVVDALTAADLNDLFVLGGYNE